MVDLKDPTRVELVRELRVFRRGGGEPSAARMHGLFFLVEALGAGAPERAFEELLVLFEKFGRDADTPIGAFCFMAGWRVGLDTVDQRREAYHEEHFVDISTAWRRSERGIQELVTIIRDLDETSRPWAFVSIFQSGNAFQPFLDFNLGHESWQPPTVILDGEEQNIDFHVHRNPNDGTRYTRRIVLPESPLKLDVDFGEPMAILRVLWPMPLWPVWQLGSWTADPRVFTRMRTFRQRAVEVSLGWWRHAPTGEARTLVRDGGIWADRQEYNKMNLPDGWGME